MAQNVTVAGASYSAVPSIVLPKTGGGTASFVDVTGTTATASDVASGKIFFAADGTQTTGAASGGGTSWTKVGETKEVTVSTTSTTAAQVAELTIDPSIVTYHKVLYVRIRDKAGKRPGYFAGNDTFFINPNAGANGTVGNLTAGARLTHRYNTSGAWQISASGDSTTYGVYPYRVVSTGKLQIYRRYSSSASLTINGTYTIDCFLLDYPAGFPAIYDE